ncbi:polysaccharide pyruvyl transferase family protein [Erythrobacter sp. HKB08]|uniref:polysaccharide pyruvyl transferase family protein n=1 Tax=Erythrobacter sp. HKB08 TaxID=2502843 RepID=UPI001008EC7E|nr:polysaccharide pyruvyl transferase family protein [Erythrobacter sp. HKB08]
MTGEAASAAAPVRAVLLNDTRVDRHHGCTTVIETIDTLAAKNGIEIVARAPAHANWREDDAVRSAIREADCIIVNGEGTIHHDRPAGKALLAAGPYAKERGKKAFLVNSTWQENSAESLEMLRDFDIVTVRESASEAELVGHGFTPRRIPDLALYHAPLAGEPREGIGYCDSVQGPKALALYRKMWAIDAEPLPIVQLSLAPMEMLRWLKRYDPSVTALLNPLHARDALRATWQDYQMQTDERDEFTALVAERELIVTGRFHMMIFALAAGTPLLALGSNTHKIEATLADAGLEPWRAIPDASHIDDALLERAAQWHGEERAKLERFVTEGRGAMERVFADIAAMARGG